MPVASHQLADICRKVREHFASHTVISILPTKGDPPDHYEATYSMAGLTKDDKGAVLEAYDHTVEISIPFGFPHFPPSCKPKSQIFHPDFDPAAICLGEFWHPDCSLADLVIYIGKMINGEIFSSKNAFNEEALTWYQNNKERFPLSPITWGNEDSSASSTSGSLRVDTLEEEDLLPDFNFFALEKNASESQVQRDGSLTELTAYGANELDYLLLLEGQKKFHQLLEIARKSNLPPEDLKPLIDNGKLQLAKAKDLHTKGRILEKQKKFEDALRLYAEVGAAVTDFPAIHADIQRITRTIVPHQKGGSANIGIGDPTAEASDREAPVAKDKRHRKRALRPDNLDSQHLQDRSPKSRIPLYLILILLALPTALGGYFWHFFQSNLKDAEIAYSGCSSSLENDQFSEAKNLCEQALRTIEKVKFIAPGKVRLIRGGADNLLKSEKLTQGLAGNIFLDGKYLPKEEANRLHSLKKQIFEANALFLAEKWQKAAELYARIESQAEKKNGLLDQPTIKDIQNKRLTAEFRVSFDRALIAMAMVAEQKGQWEVAVTELIKAQNILSKIPQAERERYSEQLQYALQKCRFEDLKSQGDRFYAKREWKNAITSYNFALLNAENDSIIPEGSVQGVRNSIERVKLYMTIDQGNMAFEAGKWEEAIEAYNRALNQLTEHGGSFTQAEAEINGIKLKRIVLKASIVKDRRTAESQLQDSNLQDARKSYQQILTNIDASGFAREGEFTATRKEISTALHAVDEKIYISEKEAYLTRNYQRLFTEIYPSTNAENLTNPVIKYVRQTPNELIFRMQCSEIGPKRPLTLVMFYAFNKKTGHWDFFHEES